MRLLGVEGADLPRAVRRVARRDEGARTPRSRRDYARIAQLALGEEETFLRTLAAGTTDPRRRGRASHEGRRRAAARGRHRVPAARHLRLPDRPHARDGRGGRPHGRPRRVRRAHDRAAHAREGRREVQEDGARRPLGLRRLPRQGETVFTGYDRPARPSRRVLGLIVDGRSVDQSPSPGRHRRGHPRRDVALRRVRRPGGRPGPHRRRRASSSRCSTCRSPSRASSATRCRSRSGEVGVGRCPRRASSTRTTAAARTQAHSGTHLIHAALRQVLGPNAHQSGSYNKAGYLRLDFAWNQALSAETRSEIEEIANNADPRQPRGRHPRDAARRGEGARRDGAVRREVRRRRAHRRHRRPVVARALRGHARRRPAPRSA